MSFSNCCIGCFKQYISEWLCHFLISVLAVLNNTYQNGSVIIIPVLLFYTTHIRAAMPFSNFCIGCFKQYISTTVIIPVLIFIQHI